MTDYTNADMVTWLRREHSNDLSPLGRDYTDGEIAAALEASDRRADQVEATAEHLHDEDTREIVALTQERDAALAVIEKVRAYAESIPRTRDRDVNPDLSNRAWLTAQDVLYVLTSAGADVLREVKADVWDEGFDAYEEDQLHHAAHGWGDEDCIDKTYNPYRIEREAGLK